MLRLELDHARALLAELARSESATPWQDLLVMRGFDQERLQARLDAAEKALGVLVQGRSATDEITVWRRAVYRHERRIA